MIPATAEYKAQRKSKPSGPKGNKVCVSCYVVSQPKIKGSGWIELILWLAFIPAGLIYSIWRREGNGKVCPQCRGQMIPADTPRAEQILRGSHV